MAVTTSVYSHSAALFANKQITFTRIKVKLLTSSASFNAAHTAVNSVDNGAAPATVTVTIASPGVFTDTAHGFSANQAIKFQTTGALPTGITADTYYYVLSPTTNTYTVSATPGGAAIATTGSQSGVHTRYASGSFEFYGNAWPVGGPTLASVSVTQVAITDATVNDAKLSATDVDIVASGGSIGPA